MPAAFGSHFHGIGPLQAAPEPVDDVVLWSTGPLGGSDPRRILRTYLAGGGRATLAIGPFRCKAGFGPQSRQVQKNPLSRTVRASRLSLA